ncbi:MAG: hypothetical protein Q9160_000396 [Pyrenula sp. 1 TL-2023]
MAESPREIMAMADQLHALAKSYTTSTDPAKKSHARHALYMQAKNIVNKVEDPMEGCMELVSSLSSLSAVRACIEMKVFENVPTSGTIKIKELAQKCGAEESLIVRMMRLLTSNGIFNEVNLQEWSHNPRSRPYSTLAPQTSAWYIKICVDEMGPGILRLGQYLEEHGLTDVHTYNAAPYSWAHGEPNLSFFEVLSKYPHRMEAFSRGLALWETAHPVVGLFPFELLRSGNRPDRPLMVDVGGGRGLSLLAVRAAYPELQGELILQDQEDVLQAISGADLPNVTKMPHDFFRPNPAQNAQVYWIRRVFHDWQDPEARKIIQAIVPAMGPDSRILISDMLLPEPVTAEDRDALWLDFMMLTIGGKERTARDFDNLARGLGVKVQRIWQTEEAGAACVVEMVLERPEDAWIEGTKKSNNAGSSK